jgi:hypothetical protein
MTSGLSEDDAALVLGCTVEEVRRLAANGTLRRFPRTGRYDADTVLRLAGRLLVADQEQALMRLQRRPDDD